MLVRPFRSLPRSTLIRLLILFLLIEVAGAAGLVATNKSSSAAAPTPTATAIKKPTVNIVVSTPYVGPPVLTVQNYPRTVINGHSETFSVRLKGLPHVLVTYSIAYPDGRTESVQVLTDGTGYSKHRFLITYKLGHGKRKPIGIGVSYSDKLQAFTRFAVQGA